jgi:peptide/nickel transport system ATP-binding protein
MGTLVNAENISGVYYTGAEDVVAVDDVSLKIEEGEVIGLADESGNGKTTLGSIISLIARPPLRVEHGTLEIDGQEDSAYLAWRCRVHAAACTRAGSSN